MKVFLGTIKKDFREGLDKSGQDWNDSTYMRGERLYINKHSWDCDWYWGLGYIGNAHLHTHFDSVLLNGIDQIDDIFIKPRFTQDEWWIIRDLFIQAYGLQEAAEIYKRGGHQTDKAYRLIDERMEKRLNDDIKIVLDKVWQIIAKPEKILVEDL